MRSLKNYRIMPIFPEEPVSDPQVSPDGTKLLFTYTTVNMYENKYDSHVWLMTLKEKKPRLFTHGKCNDYCPRWSCDGKQVIFLSDRINEKGKPRGRKDTKSQIWISPAAGGETRRLTSMKEGVQRPAFSPDGNRILFFSQVFKGERVEESDVRIVSRIKYKRDMPYTKITNDRGFFEGKWIHLFSLSLEEEAARQLTDGEFDVDTAVFSPDGGRIAFVSNLREDADYTVFKDIFMIPSRGGKPQLVWKGRGPIGALGWSPDGKNLAFTGREIKNPDIIWHKNTKLFVLPLDGGEIKDLTDGLDESVQADGVLKWSSDSRYVYFKIYDRGTARFCRVNLDGEVEQLTGGKMTVLDFSMDNSGSIMVFTATDAMSPSEVWLKDERGTSRVTEMSWELLKKLRLSKPEEFWFTASDGVKVQGWIVKPHAFEESKKYPTVLEMHGGPRLPYSFGLKAAEHEFQVLAEHGFVVVYTNPRGCLGYGEEFAARISGHWLERDYEDVLEAMDYVIKTYQFVDPNRLGVIGDSYGGLMTNWIVGHTDKFKAAIAWASICNWYYYPATSDVVYTPYLTHEYSWGKYPWDNLQGFMEKSPISYVKNVKTPLLLIHSEEDYRCPISQAEEMFAGLKVLGKETELVRFPAEGHELPRSGKPKHRVERLQHIVRWFDRYLGGS
jgi:dipeptidyl aminopeptidase/acylaminoacyl peptidase